MGLVFCPERVGPRLVGLRTHEGRRDPPEHQAKVQVFGAQLPGGFAPNSKLGGSAPWP